MDAPRKIDKPGAWVDLGLTLPVFLFYHLGVVFLNVRNASDVVTGALLSLTEGNLPLYMLVTAAIGVAFAGVFIWLGRGHALQPRKFLQIAVEGVVYATVMRFFGSWVVTKVFMGKAIAGGFVGFVMSLGAGFYEELTYRVLLFGLCAKLLVWLTLRQKTSFVSGSSFPSLKALAVYVGWSVVAAAVFSGVHYIGPLSDTFELKSFVFRWVLGMTLTAIYATRGFAAAVWAHALYDVWVLVL
jgi:hypothetical protein